VAEESNVTMYEVEYSRNGMQWVKLGQVEAYEGSGHSGRYTFNSMQSFSGLVYFRIRQIDLSGQYGYSAVRFLEFSKGESFKFWPNPAVMQIQVEATEAGEMQILNQFGRLQIQQKILPGYAQFINIGQLPKGVYVLRFQDISGQVTISRLMKN